MHRETQGRKEQSLEMRIAYKIHAMKYFNPDGGQLQIWFYISEPQKGKQNQLLNSQGTEGKNNQAAYGKC